MDSFSGLLNNSALMLTLCVIYDTFNIHAIPKIHLRDLITGILVGVIAIAVMLSPWSFTPGVFFDTRWVLLSLCGLFFGFSPTAIAVLMAGSFRLYQGGAGGVVGTVVIVTTACTGLGWRYWLTRYNKSLGWSQLYVFGLMVQLVMLSCMILMPAEMRIPILKNIAPPILIVYPFLTMLIGLILIRQEERRKTDKALTREVGERKAAEQSARKSKEDWEKTFNSITDIVSFQDPNFKILKINQAGEAVLGLDHKSIIGRPCYALFHGKEVPCPQCPILHTVKTLEPHAREMVNDKLKKIFLISASPVLDAQGNLTHITHVAKDITEKKKLEEKLSQAQRMESIGTLAGGIAHDFNNILTAIVGFAELAKLNLPPESNAAQDIDQILNSSIRATELVRHILTFSRKSDHPMTPVSPHLIVIEALKMLRASLPATIQIRDEIDGNCGKIMADQTNIHQIVINLCTNALHAMENEKGVIIVRLFQKELEKGQIIEELGESPGRFVVLEISDTGHGMDEETMANVFDPFFTTKEVGKGTGLGLSVIHGIIRDYQGFIRVKSAPGKGATFQVYFPALLQEAHLDDEDIDQDETLPAGTEKILIVDDEPSILHLAEKVFERLGYDITITSKSIDALEKIQSNPGRFDLVITDQTMPEVTGVELAQEILKIEPEMPIVLCTGYSSVISKEEALGAGIKKYIKKPVGTKTMARMVRQILDETACEKGQPAEKRE